MGAMALAFAACDESAPSVPPIQSNPQGPVLVDADVNGAPAGILTAGQVVNLQDHEDGTSLEVFSQTTDSLPAGWLPTYKLELGNDKDFVKSVVLDVTMEGKTGYVDVAELNEAHVALFGKKPEVKTVYYRVEAFASNGGTDYRIGGWDTYFGEGSFQEICRDMGIVIEDSYYLVSGLCDWTPANAKDFKFWHSKADVYDDPVFSITVEVPGDFYWKVLPPKAVEDGDYVGAIGVKVDGDEASSGNLVDTDPGAGKIAAPGWYTININLDEMTYWVDSYPARPYLCTPGSSNGWTQGDSQWIGLKNGAYAGAILVDGEFKFSINNWDQNWGKGNDGILVPDGVNISAASGLYWATANVTDLTYTLTPVTSVGVVGGLNGWSDSSPIELTPNADQSVWSGDVNLTGEWKIILNHSWGSNYGAGRLACPVFDAGNFSGYEGNYHMAVDFSGNFPMITLKEK